MRRFPQLASFALAFLAAFDAAAWGPDGHAIVAEVAQRRLTPAAVREVEALLGRGASLASVSMWADEVRDSRPETFNWHFVDIPLAETRYDAARDCPAPAKGECIVGALGRLRAQLGCSAKPAVRREALRYVVHLVADVHQPFHTVQDDRGGNEVRVEVMLHPARCPRCGARRGRDNLHALWDSTLIAATARSWGAYVARLEEGFLVSDEAREVRAGDPTRWAEEAHAAARDMRAALPPGGVVGDAYYAKALPVLDRQLARAGLRLAGWLNEAFARRCPR